MNKLRDKIIKDILIVLMFFLTGAIFYWNLFGNKADYHMHEQKNEEKIERLYELQNFAFGMEEEPFYKDFSEVKSERLFIYLSAYREDEPSKPPVTVDDVRQYLRSEFDKKGNPVVLSMPENIKSYIDWCWSDGVSYMSDYGSWLSKYQLMNKDKYDKNYLDMSETEVERFINDFNNCPDKEYYKSPDFHF